MRYIFYILLGYVLYRFITGFLIPVFRTGKQIKKQFNEMQQRMQDQMQQQPSSAPPPQQQSAKRSPVGEYIDFEEVK
ncbi:hypothetical protein [Agriterribacter sp.]|uniref:hypothetical protein n=1 Tax=Agriterribacter sp. TaxID=2821509 RepID=UPI002BF3EC7C|nr:hypothetical protein [Agriterribacter sp.]HRP57859.1 hypothetical protein [Agriterribacter sp.]